MGAPLLWLVSLLALVIQLKTYDPWPRWITRGTHQLLSSWKESAVSLLRSWDPLVWPRELITGWQADSLSVAVTKQLQCHRKVSTECRAACVGPVWGVYSWKGGSVTQRNVLWEHDNRRIPIKPKSNQMTKVLMLRAQTGTLLGWFPCGLLVILLKLAWASMRFWLYDILKL